MKTIRFFCDAFCFLFLTVLSLGYITISYAGGKDQETTIKHTGKEFPGYEWEYLEKIIKKRLFVVGYTLPIDVFVQNHRFSPCTERSIRVVQPDENGSFLNAAVIQLGILVRVFKDQESLERSISLDRKPRPPYWDEGVIMIIEITDNPFIPGLSCIIRATKRDLDGQFVDLSVETLGSKLSP